MATTVIKTTKIETVVVRFRKCDYCTALAKINVAFTFGELDFCLHHFNEHKAALETSATSITRIGGKNEN